MICLYVIIKRVVIPFLFMVNSTDLILLINPYVKEKETKKERQRVREKEIQSLVYDFNVMK